MAESYNICLDVGGTKVLGAIFDEKDKIIYRLKKRSKSGGAGSAPPPSILAVHKMLFSKSLARRGTLLLSFACPKESSQRKRHLRGIAASHCRWQKKRGRNSPCRGGLRRGRDPSSLRSSG